MMKSFWHITMSLSFFWFTAGLEQSGNQSPDVILAFSLITTFNPAKAENRIKKSLTQPYYCFEKRYYSYLKMLMFSKEVADIKKIWGSCY